MLPFLLSVTLTGLVRISKVRCGWKDLSLKLLLFINLYPASRGPSVFPDKSGRLKKSVVWQDKTGTILDPRTNWVLKHENQVRLEFWETRIFILTTQKDFEKCNNNHSHIHWMHGPTELASTIWVKLKDKKGSTKGFYLEVWKIDSVFLYQVYLLNYHNCFYICEGLYYFTGIARDSIN